MNTHISIASVSEAPMPFSEDFSPSQPTENHYLEFGVTHPYALL